MKRRVWFLLFFVGTVLPVCADDARVQPKQSVAGLLEAKEPNSRSGEPPSPVPQGLFAKLGLWAVAVIGCGALFLFARKARRKASLAAPGFDGLEIVSRLPLTHKHAVFVLKVASRRYVIGVSPDNMTFLGAFGKNDATVEGTVLEKTPMASSSSLVCGYSARPEDREAVSASQTSSRVLRDADLAPYRKQMDRLRGLLREMRGATAGEEYLGDPRAFEPGNREQKTENGE